MLYDSKRKKLCRHLLVGGVACVAGLAAFSCTDTYDLDTRQPSGLNTIYGYMQDKGNYSTFLNLIDDLGQTEYMSKTGSVTLFIANDDVFAEFFRSNEWGVSSYDQLSLTQKKLLLNSAMISNVYPVSLLSTASGTATSVKGEVVRRPSSQSLYDSVSVVPTNSAELPQNSHWDRIRSNRSEVVLYKDASGSAPMLTFTPMFTSLSRLEYSDVDFVYGQPAGTMEAEINANEAGTYINRSRILSSQFCKNGYIHEVDRVITPLDNMAEVIRKDNRLQAFSSILERFAAPWSTRALTEDYNIAKDTDVDSVFVKRYFSTRSEGSAATGQYEKQSFTQDVYEEGMEDAAALKFDPGWNRYVRPGSYNTTDPLMEDMAVMLVPTDEAVQEWWNNGGGKVIKDQYGTLENTPATVLDDLVNVNMLPTMTNSLPSRFATVLNDANEPLGIEQSDIEEVLLACNGLVYVTNKVFPPASYSSVLFPAVIDVDNLNVVNNAIGKMDNTNTLQFDTYLNSMVSRYCLVLPNNNGMMSYIDPVSLGQNQAKLWEFQLNPARTAQDQLIYANIYNITLKEDGTWEKLGESSNDSKGRTSPYGTNNAEVKNRLQDLLDNCVGLGELEEGKEFYQTKGNHFIRLGGLHPEGNGYAASTVSGGLAELGGEPAHVLETYHMDNGTTFVTDGIPLSTPRSVADVLATDANFSEFYEMMLRSGSTATSYNPSSSGNNSFYAAAKTNGNLVNVSVNSNGAERTYQLLNAYHYTVYAPTNEAMQLAYDAGLPSLDDLEAAEAWDEAQEELGDDGLPADSADHIRSVMRDFVKYHVQLNSIYMDKGFSAGIYESAKSNLALQDTILNGVRTYLRDESDGYFICRSASPFKIRVNSVSRDQLSITDAMGNEQTIGRRSDGLFNLQAREYWLGNGSNGVTSAERATTISNSSSVVIHAVNKPLYYNYDPNASEEQQKLNQFHYIPRKIAAEQD